jgi:endonuclease YncB( thermonuclease family)
MPVFCIPGSYRVVGSSPDGDSVRFYADDPDVFTRAGLSVRLNSKGGAQLRLDAIDALETHYSPPRSHKMWRQPRELALAAANALLDHLGFTDVQRAEDGTVTSAAPDAAPGYILTRFADVYGRPVSFAYAGSPEQVGDESVEPPPAVTTGGVPTVHIGVGRMRRSVNYRLLAAGLVYPTFYSQLYVDLRQALAREAEAQRKQRAGVWASDATLDGFTLESRDQLEQELVILPKLFRRLTEYLSLDETGSVSLDRFHDFLAQHGDRLFTVPDGHATGFDTFVAVKDAHLHLTVPPERMVFLEK